MILSLLICTHANSETIDTGNILSNSTFGTGTTYDSTGWNISEHTHGHNYMSSGGGNDIGGSVAAVEDTVIDQTIKLSEDTNMITEEIQGGWSSTVSADIWFWNAYNNTTTLKQEIIGSDGSTTTQQRIIEDTGCGYMNCGQFENYTDTYVQGPNVHQDFDIKVSVENTNTLTGHYGPDIDNVELKVVYNKFDPIDEDTEEILDDIDDNIIIYTPEEDSFVVIDDSFSEDFYFEDMFVVEDMTIMNELPDIEEFEEAEISMEEDMVIDEEMEMEEEIEMEEEMEEETIAMEEDTQEEAIQEEEVSNDNNDMETTEENSDSMEEKQESEEGTSEVAENEDEESKPDSEDTEDTEVQTEDSKKQEIVQQKEVQDKKSINVEVAEVEVTSVKEVTLFSNQDSLDNYTDIVFYQADNIYVSVDTDFFQQIDLSQYNQQIYENVSLSSYIDNDPIEIQKKKLLEIRRSKQKILLELQALRN